MIPVIDFKSSNVLEKICKAYTIVGFAVFNKSASGERMSSEKFGDFKL